MEEIKKAYGEILEVLGKHKDIVVFNFKELEQKASNHIFGSELVEKFGLVIDPKDVRIPEYDYTIFSNKRFIGKYGDKYRRTIAWSDNELQPEDEILFSISFSTGAYMFGDDYPTELFYQFFQELKSYNPDYSDTTNKCLYWKLENAKDVFNEYGNILQKYHEINKTDSKKRKIEKLKKELGDLEK